MSNLKREQRWTGADARGKEIFEIKPVVLGGSPTDPANKILLSREQHIKVVVFWNRVIVDLRTKRGGETKNGRNGVGDLYLEKRARSENT